MILTNHQYTRSAWHNGYHSGLCYRISLEAWEAATTVAQTNGQAFDDNITAAIHAGEWLDKAIETYRGL
jgi:hypothetical protein